MKRDGRPQSGVSLPQGGQVYVDPSVDPASLPAAAAYQAGIMARRGGLPKQDRPLDPPRPPIPVLSGGPSDGGGGATMAEYARAERAAASGPATPSHTGPSIIAEPAPAPQRPTQQTRHTVASLGLAPADLLPENAKADPAYRHGYGSEYASNQPELAARYGVLRNGQYLPPQKLGGKGGAKSSLRPETVQDLEQLQRLQSGQLGGKSAAEEEAEIRSAVAGGIGGAAGRVGGASAEEPERPQQTEDEKQKALRSAIDQMDAFEFNTWRQLTMRQILHSEEEREAIEKRLKPLDIAELIQNNTIRQRIPIVPGKYEVTLQSYDGQIELALKRLVMMEARSVDVGESYLLDKHSFMSLAVGLHKINDKVYPDVVDAEGVFSDELFLKKFNMVMKLPLHMLASIGVNLMWFEMRVRRLYSATAVGNG